jgi:hypothetical protein
VQLSRPILRAPGSSAWQAVPEKDLKNFYKPGKSALDLIIINLARQPVWRSFPKSRKSKSKRKKKFENTQNTKTNLE